MQKTRWILAGGAFLALACGSGTEEMTLDIEMPPPVDAPADAAPAIPQGTPGTHCAASHVYFSCPTTNGKVISVCGGTADDNWLSYRFGKLDEVEKVWPEETDLPSSGRFEYEAVTYAQSAGDVLRFSTDGGFRFEVTELSGGGGRDGEANNFMGVYVFDGDDKMVNQVDCAEPPTTDWDGLAAVGVRVKG